MRTLNRTVTLEIRGGGCSLSVLNRGTEGQEKCLSSTERAEKESVLNSRKQRKGVKKRKKLANNKGREAEQQNDSRQGSEMGKRRK